MKLDINLASQPYEDIRQFLLQWGTAVALVALVTLGLVSYAVRTWTDAREARREITQLREDLARLDREQQEAVAVLSRPEYADLRRRAAFTNGLIARRTFSWTQVFAALEKVMPAQVHVISLEPEVVEGNQIELHMRVAGRSRDQALELVRRMETSERFRLPELRSERTQADEEVPIEFDIVALYVPEVAGAGGAP
ncbi:MAG TPA: hypothetical protein VNK82_09470 [Terriglobales bacterium]|nr:hypothetical protein [Terriglobales bacterium]